MGLDALFDKGAGAVQIFLEYIQTHGLELPEAPQDANYSPALMDERRENFGPEATCYKCLGSPEIVFVAVTFDGPRWLDLCLDCARWMLRGVRMLES